MTGKGGLSGGTAASMMEIAEQSSSGSNSRFPFLLNPRGQWSSIRITPHDKDRFLPYYLPVAKYATQASRKQRLVSVVRSRSIL
jgi:hypothetical protein